MSGRRQAHAAARRAPARPALLHLRGRLGPRPRRRAEWLTDGLEPRDGTTIHDQIEASGAPALLLERYAGRLEYHDPWHHGREVSHLFRGEIDAFEADALLGRARPRAPAPGRQRRSMHGVDGRAAARYHLLPRGASKAGAVAATCGRAGTRPRRSSRSATRARTSAPRRTSARSGSSPTRSSAIRRSRDAIRGSRNVRVAEARTARASTRRSSRAGRAALRIASARAVDVGLGRRPVRHRDPHRGPAVASACRRPSTCRPPARAAITASVAASSPPKRSSTWFRTTSFSTSTPPRAERARPAGAPARSSARPAPPRPSRPSDRSAA